MFRHKSQSLIITITYADGERKVLKSDRVRCLFSWPLLSTIVGNTCDISSIKLFNFLMDTNCHYIDYFAGLLLTDD